MRHYEIVLLVHPDQSEQVPAMLERYKDMVSAEKGLIHRSEDWGRRRLAYMINDVHKAHYAMLNVECSLDTLRELEKNFKFNDSIIRSLVIRRDHAITEQSALAKARDEEEREDARQEAEQRLARERAAARPPKVVEKADDAEAKQDADSVEEPVAAEQAPADDKAADPDQPSEAEKTAPQPETA